MTDPGSERWAEKSSGRPVPRDVYARAIRSSLRQPSDVDWENLTTSHEIIPSLDDGAAYTRVCGYRLSDQVPATYAHVLAFPYALDLQTRLPYPVLGTIHVEQEFVVHRPMQWAELLHMTVRAADPRPHPRGQQYDLHAKFTADGADVVTSRGTYLRRDGTSGEKRDCARQGTAEDRPETTATWRLPANLGRRYARVSGDLNPIHLSRPSARAFGFRRPIAHGMWTLAAALAALDGRLPDAYTVRAEFKRPLSLPGAADLAMHENDEGWSFGVYEHAGARPHLLGDVRPLRSR